MQPRERVPFHPLPDGVGGLGLVALVGLQVARALLGGPGAHQREIVRDGRPGDAKQCPGGVLEVH